MEKISTLIPSFVEDAAEKLGETGRNVRYAVRIGERIAPEAADAIRETPLANNRSQLSILVSLDPEDQIEAAEKIASGEAEGAT